MSTKPEHKSIPEIPTSLDEFIEDITYTLSNPRDTETDEELSKDPNGWKREEAYFIFNYLLGPTIRDEIKRYRDQGKTETDISNDLMRNKLLLKLYIFMLSSDPFKHYNRGYYNEKIHDLAEFAIRANKFTVNAYRIVKALPEFVDFTKLPDDYYVTIDKFILIGYDSKGESLKFDIDILRWKHFAGVKDNSIGVGIQGHNKLMYYREIPVAYNQDFLDSNSNGNQGSKKGSSVDTSGGKSVSDTNIAKELEFMAYLLKIAK